MQLKNIIYDCNYNWSEIFTKCHLQGAISIAKLGGDIHRSYDD